MCSKSEGWTLCHQPLILLKICFSYCFGMMSGRTLTDVPNSLCKGESVPVPPFSKNEFILLTFSKVNGGTEHLLRTTKHLTGQGSLATTVISAPIAVIDVFVTLSPQRLPVFIYQINFSVSSILNSSLAKSAGMWES